MDAQIPKAQLKLDKFNPTLELPYELRLMDFQAAMSDVYDFFFDVNSYLLGKGLARLEDMLRPANLSGTLSDMLTDSIGKHSRVLTPNRHFNGHPDLIVKGRYANDAEKSASEGVEIKATKKHGAAVDTHGGRDQTLCTWVYAVDNDPGKPAHARNPLEFREVYIATVKASEFRHNARGPLGTRTATLDREGIERFRQGWVFKDIPTSVTGRSSQRTGWRSATS